MTRWRDRGENWAVARATAFLGDGWDVESTMRTLLGYEVYFRRRQLQPLNILPTHLTVRVSRLTGRASAGEEM